MMSTSDFVDAENFKEQRIYPEIFSEASQNVFKEYFTSLGEKTYIQRDTVVEDMMNQYSYRRERRIADSENLVNWKQDMRKVVTFSVSVSHKCITLCIKSLLTRYNKVR
jgi:hypothetical protein